MPDSFPERIATEGELDDVLTRPTSSLTDAIRELESPLVVLGAGGKMGPSLCALARRAADSAGHRLDIIAVSRFSNPAARQQLEQHGIRTHAADLLDRDQVRSLPEARNVVYLVGLKFGTASNPARTWAVNALVPALCTEKYGDARVVTLSTGNVYPLVPVSGGGSQEDAPLTPLGEYANAAVARERIFEYGSERFGTRIAAMRLSYAVDLRYGVIPDLAHRIVRGEPIPLATGYFHCIWQGDANDMILRSFPLADCPPAAFNLTGPQRLSVRETAEHLGRLLGREPVFEGTESGEAFLSNCSKLTARLGPPQIDSDTLINWTAAWVAAGGRSLGLPTHFETRDGGY